MLGGYRRDHKMGATALIYTAKDSPRLGGYRFDSSLSGSSDDPWVEKYTVSDLPSFEAEGGSGVDYGTAASAGPYQKLFTGGKNSTSMDIYSYSLHDGIYGKTQSGVTDNFTDVTNIAFTQDKKYIVVASKSKIGMYEHSDSGLGTQQWLVNTPQGSNFSSPYQCDAMILAKRTPYPSQGSDEFIVTMMNFFGNTACVTYDLSGNVIDTLDLSGSGGAAPVMVNSFKPPAVNDLEIGITGSKYRSVVFNDFSGRCKSYPMRNGVFYSDGNFDIAQSSPITSGVSRSIFDSNGRLIIATTTSPYLSVYNKNPSTGVYTLASKGTPSLASIAWSGGTINHLSYDEDQDILFVSHQSSPYLSAIQMSQSGFAFKYGDMASPPSSSVIKMSLVYDESWKSFNTGS